jgi:hypothetical protein
LRFNDTQGRFTGTLAVMIAAADSDGKIRGSERGTMNLRMSQQTHTIVAEHGARLLSRLNLQPGRYQLRVALSSGAGGARGSVHYDLDVPDFTKAPLSMSGVVLASAAASRAPTTGNDHGWPKLMIAPPTTMREFETGDRLWLFGEVYVNEQEAGQQIDIETSIQAGDGAIVFTHREAFAIDVAQGKSVMYRHTVPIALADVSPGRYILTMTARVEGGRSRPSTRQIPFSVR